jgi:hypothetical protein
MAEVSNIINKIGLLQSLANTMNHKNHMLNRDLDQEYKIKTLCYQQVYFKLIAERC